MQGSEDCLQGDWGGQACAAWAPRADIAYHTFTSRTRHSDGEAAPQQHTLQSARLAASWGGTVAVFMVPYTVSLQPRAPQPSPASDGSTAAAPPPPPPLYLQPDRTCTFDLAAGEVAAKLGWISTAHVGVFKLVVLAVPQSAGGDGTDGPPTRDVIVPTIYVYDADSGEREEVLELGALLPEGSRMSRWLAGMNAGVCDRLNALGETLTMEIGAQRGLQTEAPWAAAHYLPPADPLLVETFHMLCDGKLVGVLLSDSGSGQSLVLHQARHMSWQSQVRLALHTCLLTPAKHFDHTLLLGRNMLQPPRAPVGPEF